MPGSVTTPFVESTSIFEGGKTGIPGEFSFDGSRDPGIGCGINACRADPLFCLLDLPKGAAFDDEVERCKLQTTLFPRCNMQASFEGGISAYVGELELVP